GLRPRRGRSGLPLKSLQVNALFAAVPQIEHNWTARRLASPQASDTLGATSARASNDDLGMYRVMKIGPAHVSRRSLAIAATLAVWLALGAHAALNNRALDAAKPVVTEQGGEAATGSSRLALVIGNGHYPDAHA